MFPGIDPHASAEFDLTMRLPGLYNSRIVRFERACGTHKNKRAQIFGPYQDPGTSKIATVTHWAAPDSLRIS